MGRRTLGSLIALLLLASCGRSSMPTMVVLGPARGVPTERWSATLRAVRAVDYEPRESDARTGRIVITARADEKASFVVQLYREGWVVVNVEGPLAYRYGLPDAVADEYARLLRVLMARVTSGERT